MLPFLSLNHPIVQPLHRYRKERKKGKTSEERSQNLTKVDMQ